MATPTLTDTTALTRFFGSTTRLAQFTNSDSGVQADAIAAASSIAANALYQQYTEASVDALTATTCPDELQRHVNAIVAEILTSGGRGRPEDVQVDADNARAYLDAVRNGRIDVPGLDALGSGVEGGGGSGPVRYRMPTERVFDRDAPSKKYKARFWEI